MLEEIVIENLGVIQKAQLNPSPGLTVITGETGAGKSMVLNALNMLLGKRVNNNLIHNGANSAKVEGCWNVATAPEHTRTALGEFVEDSGGEIEDGELFITRSLTNDGKSKATLGGSRVPASRLSEVGHSLVNIHGQSDQIKLKNPAAQIESLDRFVVKLEKDDANLTEDQTFRSLIEKLGILHKAFKAAKSALEDATNNSDNRAREISYLETFIREFEEVSPEMGEIGELESEIDRLANIEEIGNLASEAYSVFSPEVEDMISVETQLRTVMKNLESIQEFDKSEDFTVISELAGNIYPQVSELESLLSTYVNNIDTDSIEELHDKEDRLQVVKRLVKKYAPGMFFDQNDEALSNILDQYDEVTEKLETLNSANRPLDELEEDCKEAFANLLKVAQIVSQKRTEAAAVLSSAVNTELEALSMGGMKFEVAVNTELTEKSITKNGGDSVFFNIQTPGAKVATAVAKTASGGELSRIMLALEVVIADPSETATFVFDEVDSGVGGEVAIEIGKRLARLAEEAQVILVTHLPQIASLADTHFKIVKTVTENSAVTEVIKLGNAERVSEITRMLSGRENSKSGQAHARELIRFGMDFKTQLQLHGKENSATSPQSKNVDFEAEDALIEERRLDQIELSHQLPVSEIELENIPEADEDTSSHQAPAYGRTKVLSAANGDAAYIDDFGLASYKMQRFGNQFVTFRVSEGRRTGDTLVIYNEEGSPILSAGVRSEVFGIYPEKGNIFVSNIDECEGIVEELHNLGVISKIVKPIKVVNVEGNYEVKLAEHIFPNAGEPRVETGIFAPRIAI